MICSTLHSMLTDVYDVLLLFENAYAVVGFVNTLEFRI